MGPIRPSSRIGRLRERAVALVIALLVLALPRVAAAWVELHVARDDVRLEVEPTGQARVEHRIVLLVSGGPLTSFTIRGVDPDLVVEDGGYLALEKDVAAGALEGALPIAAKKIDGESSPGVPRADLEITLDGGRGVGRGRWVALVRYRTDLAAQGALTRDGASTWLRWVGPTWDDGLDTTRATFVLPKGPTEPRALDADEGEGSQGTFLSSLTRRQEADHLEVVRPYASRGERVVWRVRADRRALPLGDAEAPTSPQAPERGPVASGAGKPRVGDLRDGASLLAGLLLFVVVAGLVAAHGLELRRHAEEAGQKARPLVPLAVGARAGLAAAAFVGGVALQLVLPASLPGAALVATTAAFAWHLPARARAQLRGPGAWLPVSVDEALAKPSAPRRGWFDLGGWRGRVALLALTLLSVGAALLASRSSTYHAVLVGLDLVPLLALFMPSRDRLLVPDLAVAPIPLLAEVARRIERSGRAVRVVPRVRLPQGQADADELRLALLPQPALRGLRAVEIAVAWTGGPGGYLLLPEVLLRYEERSPCEAAARSLEAYARVGRGRKADERVLAISPKIPDARTTVELALAVLDRVRAPAVAPPSVELPAAKRRAPTKKREAAKPAAEAPVPVAAGG